MTKKDTQRKILVYAHWHEMENPMLMGNLYSERLRGREVFSFEYDTNWLKNGPSHLLDPTLQFYPGPHYLTESQDNFGIFLDTCPDRWGRVLMRRREAARARIEQRPEQKLFETDYLLGVYDGHRMGALRFKLSENGPFLDDHHDMASPPWTSIPELEEICLRLEEEDAIQYPEFNRWLNLIVAPGSSLGGARPKASITDRDGSLWIAKFPSRSDHEDVGAWEIVTYEMAKLAGLNMALSRAKKYSSGKYTFLTKRFDRTASGQRIHFASAMTMLGYNDGQDHTHGASYLEIVEFLMNHGANVEQDLEELWRRIVFNICVSNTDDHLRNHGFILTNEGWRLSPAFDINPNETGTGLKLNISGSDNALDPGLALQVCEFFRLDKVKAEKIIEEVKFAVRKWKSIASRYGLSRSEQEIKSIAFQWAYK